MSVGAYSSIRSSSGSSVPLLPFWTISASVSPVLNRTSGRSPLASMRFFFSAYTWSGRFSQVIAMLVSSSHCCTSSISEYSGASGAFVPPKVSVRVSSTMGRPSSLKPKSADLSSTSVLAPPPVHPARRTAPVRANAEAVRKRRCLMVFFSWLWDRWGRQWSGRSGQLFTAPRRAPLVKCFCMKGRTIRRGIVETTIIPYLISSPRRCAAA